LRRWGNLDNFEDVALDWLAGESLAWDKRRNLLQRMQRPDSANLPKMVAEDLVADRGVPFGSYGIHKQMTQAQLDELVKLRPELLNQHAYVNIYLTKLQPNADEDWQHDRKLTEAYLDRLQKFVERLDPVHNGLKAHVQFHRLALDRSRDTFNR